MARSSGSRLAVAIVLPVLATVIAVFALLRTHASVLQQARGREMRPRTLQERAAMLASGDCALSRRHGRLLGKPVRSSRDADRISIQRFDVDAVMRVDTAAVRVVPCADAVRAGVRLDSAVRVR